MKEENREGLSSVDLQYKRQRACRRPKMDLQLRISVFLLVIMPCGTEEQKVNLTATVGASITFPDPVTERGYFIFKGKPIASVSKGEFEIEEDIYTNRLHWSNNTGLFTLSGLQKNDSGVYTVDSKKGSVFTRFYELKLYDPVAVVVTAVNVSRDSCTLQCSVNKTEQTTLSWFKGEDSVDRSSSEVLLLTVQLRNYNSTYRCVAENPAENKTVRVDITTVCKLSDTESSGSPSVKKYYTYVLIPIVLTALVLCFAVMSCQDKKKHQHFHLHKIQSNTMKLTSAKEMTISVVMYQIHQEALTTLYDEIQMANTCTSVSVYMRLRCI